MRLRRLLLALLCSGLARGVASAGEQTLRIYCVYHAAHGFRGIGREYGKGTGVSLQLPLHCREHFDPTAERLKDGDLLLTTDPKLFEKARERGLLASEPQTIGCVTPIIAVMKGNPHGIQSLADLGRKGLVVAYPSTCIGNVALKTIARNRLEAIVKPHMTVRTGNRTGVLRPLVSGKAHAAITWSCAIIESGRKDVAVVPIPKDHNIIDPLQVAVLKSCRDRARAQAFLDYLQTEPARKMLRDFRLREREPADAR